MNENDNQDGLKECKLVLIGESAVGKTCIATRFIKDEFNYNEITTFPASFVTKTIQLDELSEKYVKFSIWDTCGQEKYRSIGKVYYKGVKAAILVYDITSKKSFEQISQYWYKQLIEYAPNDINKFIIFI